LPKYSEIIFISSINKSKGNAITLKVTAYASRPILIIHAKAFCHILVVATLSFIFCFSAFILNSSAAICWFV